MSAQDDLIGDVLGQVVELGGTTHPRAAQLAAAVTDHIANRPDPRPAGLSPAPKSSLVVTVDLTYMLDHYTEDEVWAALERLREMFG